MNCFKEYQYKLLLQVIWWVLDFYVIIDVRNRCAKGSWDVFNTYLESTPHLNGLFSFTLLDIILGWALGFLVVCQWCKYFHLIASSSAFLIVVLPCLHHILIMPCHIYPLVYIFHYFFCFTLCKSTLYEFFYPFIVFLLGFIIFFYLDYPGKSFFLLLFILVAWVTARFIIYSLWSWHQVIILVCVFTYLAILPSGGKLGFYYKEHEILPPMPGINWSIFFSIPW